MANKKQHKIRSTLVPTDKQAISLCNRSASPFEQSIVTQEKGSVPSSRAPKLLYYTPPDVLMFPLFSAIQRRAWTRAKKLSHELILCDPERKMYHDLYIRIDQITNLIDQRAHLPSTVSSATAAISDGENSKRQ